MPAPRLSDSQKEELVARYRQGETAQALADAYGCSANTVSRVLKAALDPEELASLKTKKPVRGRTSTPAEPIAASAVAEPAVEAIPVQESAQAEAPPVEESPLEDEEPASALPIDDADDFGDDGLDDGLDDGGVAEADDEALSATLTAAAGKGGSVEAKPLLPGLLPGSVYLLVDKTVELQPQPLREFPELGSLPEPEQELQALMLFTNPRQAKRHCGRSQRVIKVPDSGVLERRSSYLVAQGITRLVLEGGCLYSLPGC